MSVKDKCIRDTVAEFYPQGTTASKYRMRKMLAVAVLEFNDGFQRPIDWTPSRLLTLYRRKLHNELHNDFV